MHVLAKDANMCFELHSLTAVRVPFDSWVGHTSFSRCIQVAVHMGDLFLYMLLCHHCLYSNAVAGKLKLLSFLQTHKKSFVLDGQA